LQDHNHCGDIERTNSYGVFLLVITVGDQVKLVRHHGMGSPQVADGGHGLKTSWIRSCEYTE
jgi:hypothetical protein